MISLDTEKTCELAVLGTMISDSAARAVALSKLRADAMTGPEREILHAVRDLEGRRALIDHLVVVDELNRRGSIAGPADVTNCDSPETVNLEARIEIVNQCAMRRALKTSLLESLRDLDGLGDPSEAVLAVEQRVLAVRNESKRGAEAEPLAVIFDRVLTAPERGMATGYGKLDWATGGLRPKRLFLVGARPGMGKTALGVCIARNLARSGKWVAFISLEMDVTEIAERLAALSGQVELTRVRFGGPAAEAACLEASKLPIHLVNPARSDALNIRAAVLRMDPKPTAIVVDYVQLMAGNPGESRAEVVDGSTRALKQIAMELDVPVIAMAQVNRDAEERGTIRRPTLANLRESGGLESHADVVVFVHRPDYYRDPRSPAAELVIAKNRHGPTCIQRCAFVGPYARFDPLGKGAGAPENELWGTE